MEDMEKTQLTLTKDNVGIFFSKTKKQLEELIENTPVFGYVTLTKYLPKFGYIHTMSLQELLVAKRYLDTKLGETMQSEMLSLDISESELPKTNNTTILGIKIDVWVNDMKTRVKEIRHNTKISNLEKDLNILAKHLDKKDLFNIDVDKLSSDTLTF